MSTEIVPVAVKVVKQLARKRTLAGVLVAIVAYIIAGHWLVYAVAAVALVTLLAMFVIVAREARKIRKHPPVDYPAIARMEREVWGETFGREGAPARRTSRQNVTDARIMELHRAGYRTTEIAAQLGLVQESVIRAIVIRSNGEQR